VPRFEIQEDLQQPNWTLERRKTGTKAPCRRKGYSRRRDWDEPGKPKTRGRICVLKIGLGYVDGTVMISWLTGKISFFAFKFICLHHRLS
jgi:hypothetical protein